jgi:hypothetical protein
MAYPWPLLLWPRSSSGLTPVSSTIGGLSFYSADSDPPAGIVQSQDQIAEKPLTREREADSEFPEAWSRAIDAQGVPRVPRWLAAACEDP